MKFDLKYISLIALSIVSSTKAEDCLKAMKHGNWDGKEVVELNIKRENLCTSTRYELCKPIEVELLEIMNVPKKNYIFDFGTTGLDSDATLYRETISDLVDGNVQYFQIDFQTKYKNKYLLFGFVDELCKNEDPSVLDKIKVRVYGELNSTDDPSTEYQPEEAISLEDPKIKSVQKECFDNVLSFPYLFSQKPNKRDFLFDDILELRDENISENTDAVKKLDDLTEEFGKNMDTTCRNWLYLLSLGKCYLAQQSLPEEFTFDPLHSSALRLLNDMQEKNLSKRLTLCRRDMKPRKLDIEQKLEDEYKKKYGEKAFEEMEKAFKDEL